MATVAILYPGDMGHAVGRVLHACGHRVITCLAGRSERSRRLAGQGGLLDVGSLSAVAAEADMILSILPPANARDLAQAMAAAMREAGRFPAYADCNAIAPQTTLAVGSTVSAAGALYIDAGIVGPPPGRGAPPRFYVSGPDTAPLAALDGHGIVVRRLSERIGDASAMKMCYASLTKGTATLQTAVLMAAHRFGLDEPFWAELQESQGPDWQRMRTHLPRLPADAARWIGEMEEIARTYADAGLPTGFHEAAAQVYEVLTRTPYAAERRETLDPDRTVEQVIADFAAALPARR